MENEMIERAQIFAGTRCFSVHLKTEHLVQFAAAEVAKRELEIANEIEFMLDSSGSFPSFRQYINKLRAKAGREE